MKIEESQDYGYILQQCQIWNENNEYQEIIGALEAISEMGCTPEAGRELARVYNNQVEL